MPNLLHKVTDAEIQCICITVTIDIPNEYHENFDYVFRKVDIEYHIQKTGGKLTSCTVNSCISLRMRVRKY